MSMCLLHKNKLERFRQWLTEKGYEVFDPRGEFQVMGFKHPEGRMIYFVYDRLDAPEHYTVDRRIEYVVRKFIKETR